jgi:hypothetical protein
VRRRSNCFVFALWYFVRCWAYWARNKRRCKTYPYWSLRPSLHITGWHWLVRHPKFDRWVHYEPVTPKGIPIAALDKIWYHGRVTRDDPYHYTEEE